MAAGQAYIRTALLLKGANGSLVCAKGVYGFFYNQGDSTEIHVSFALTGEHKTEGNRIILRNIRDHLNTLPGFTAELNNDTLMARSPIREGGADAGALPNDLCSLGLMNPLEKSLAFINQQNAFNNIIPQVRAYLGTQRDGTLPTPLPLRR